MATQQEVNDLQYGILQAKQQSDLRDMFATAIISTANSLGYYTYDDIIKITSINLASASYTMELKGLTYLRNLTTLALSRSGVTGKLDVSSNVNLTTIDAGVNGITYIDGIGLLRSLETLSVPDNELASVDIRYLADLKILYLYDNANLSEIVPSNIDLDSITNVLLYNCALGESQVNRLLRIFANAAAYQTTNTGAPLLAIVDISGGTNAIPTGDGLTAITELQALGVPVTYNS